MKTRVEFRSAKFPPYDGEQERINPGLWGKRLAEYFKEKLAAKTIETGEITFEDWGCVLPIKNKSFDLWIGCGHQFSDEDQFLSFIEPCKPFVRKLLKRMDTREQVSQLAEAIGEILATDPDIRDVRWLAEEIGHQPSANDANWLGFSDPMARFTVLATTLLGTCSTLGARPVFLREAVLDLFWGFR